MTLGTCAIVAMSGAQSRAVRARSSQLEIDLFLEGINFRDLDFDFVAETKYSPVAAAHEMVSRGIEDVKIVDQSGKRHEAGHAEARDIDEETEVADVSHQRRITLRPAGPDLRVEKREEFHVFTVALGIG